MLQAMLPDGSNPEGVDPDPPLTWTGHESLTHVVLYGDNACAPTAKVRAHLLYYKIPFSRVMKAKSGSSYTLTPVLDVAGRQVNDSWIILKHILRALRLKLNEEWERKISYQLDPSIKYFTTAGDVAGWCHAASSCPFICGYCVGVCCAFTFRPRFEKEVKRGLYELVDPVVVMTEFKDAMGKKAFFAGSCPGPIDVSMYGELASFLRAGMPTVEKNVKKAGLEQWLERMQARIPSKELFRKK